MSSLSYCYTIFLLAFRASVTEDIRVNMRTVLSDPLSRWQLTRILGSPTTRDRLRRMVQTRGSAMSVSRMRNARLKNRSEIGRVPLGVGDFQNALVVEQIDVSAYNGKAGDPIRITASDDFEVAGVEVAIHDTGGAVLEHGAAAAADGHWNYITTTDLPPGQPVSIEVTATDRPGHKTTKTQTRG